MAQSTGPPIKNGVDDHDDHDAHDLHDDEEFMNALKKIAVVVGVMYAFWVFETLVCLIGSVSNVVRRISHAAKMDHAHSHGLYTDSDF